ncbi:carbonic anhydrase [Clostridium lundense]|uniref:carbonic anhydrase n=1 Tax=Clostridium lundense TaxID=319475 RepID=UPI000AA97DEE|nr:carbonic anhydrase [Clostridium lundense]
MKKRFGTALNCIDGRTQIPVIKWMKENFHVDYVDLITEPGMDKVLSQGKWIEMERLREKAMVSITAHNLM